MRKFFSFKKEKPVIFNNDQQAIVAKEYKLKLKSLISINEDMRNEIKLSSESLNSYKTYLSEIGLSKKTNLINTSRNFNVKTLSLIQKDNTKLVKSIETIKSIISAYEKQLKDLCLKFDEKNNLASDTTLADDQLFILKNSYNAKEAQIMNLQLIISSFLDRKEELYFEYHDIESKTVTNCMDHFMTGIRNEMARTTRLLNIQKNKVFEHTKNIEDKKKELEDMKHPKFNTPTQTTPEVNLSTKVDTEMNEKTPKKKLRKEDKIEIIKQLEQELKHNFEQIDSLSSEISEVKSENQEMHGIETILKNDFSSKYAEIYTLEMKLEKMQAKLKAQRETAGGVVS